MDIFDAVVWNHVIVWGSYIVAIFLLLLLFGAFRRKHIFMMIVWLLVLGCFMRARFVEPQKIAIQEMNIQLGVNTTVAVIADTHLGVYKDQRYFGKVVDAINKRPDIDLVFIAGDFLYKPTDNQSIEELFSPLATLQKPVYAVLGNHDVGVPGDPTLRLPLIKALEKYDVTVMQNDAIWVNNFYLLGMGPYMSGEADTLLLEQVAQDETVVVLTHNPDTILQYPNNHADLTVTGHTHCGQVRPPLLYGLLKKHILPVEGDFDCGLTEENNTLLFITPGVGEVLLPIRFNATPTISILHL